MQPHATARHPFEVLGVAMICAPPSSHAPILAGSWDSGKAGPELCPLVLCPLIHWFNQPIGSHGPSCARLLFYFLFLTSHGPAKGPGMERPLQKLRALNKDPFCYRQEERGSRKVGGSFMSWVFSFTGDGSTRSVTLWGGSVLSHCRALYHPPQYPPGPGPREGVPRGSLNSSGQQTDDTFHRPPFPPPSHFHFYELM